MTKYVPYMCMYLMCIVCICVCLCVGTSHIKCTCTCIGYTLSGRLREGGREGWDRFLVSYLMLVT